MASSLDSKKLSTENYQRSVDCDPDATTAFYATLPGGVWFDMRDFGALMVQFFRTVGTSDLQTFAIFAATDSAGTNPTEIKVRTVDPDAVGDQVFIECVAQEIAHIGATLGLKLRYVALKLQFATGTDEGVATYTFGHARYPADGLTSDYVS